MEKTAISAGLALRALEGRAAQGVRVAPGMMQAARGAAAQGLAATPSTVRRAALHAGEAGLAQRKMQASAANPLVQGARQRLLGGYDRAVRGTPGVFDRTRPLPLHYDHGAVAQAVDRGVISHPMGYSQGHLASISGGSTLHDPHALLPSPRAIPSATGSAPTAVSGTRPKSISAMGATVKAKTPRPLVGAV